MIKELGRMEIENSTSDGGCVVFMLDTSGVPEQDIIRYLDRDYGPTRCSHGYDCCGCAFSLGYRVLDKTPFQWVVKATYIINI